MGSRRKLASTDLGHLPKITTDSRVRFGLPEPQQRSGLVVDVESLCHKIVHSLSHASTFGYVFQRSLNRRRKLAGFAWSDQVFTIEVTQDL